ncbi:membrane protein [Platysternon megacephalum]|uniref:Membrane protein n=1 Tax=Platysternon megacephalum TaxID=55544 RepID=A0A4D9DBJ4_9SAUR|nr:membrane protein [Platysternon megacephalum]
MIPRKILSVAAATALTLGGLSTLTATAAGNDAGKNAAPVAKASSAAEAKKKPDVSTQIVGGVRVPEGAYPWMVRLSMGCGGTLVSKDIVITAQHCTEGSSRFTVSYGSNTLSNQRTVSVAGIREGRGSGYGDWTVVKLATPINISNYARVATDTSYDQGPRFRTMGWGDLYEDSRVGSEYLMQVDVPFVADSECGNSAEICAGDLQRGGIDSCQGDSGGPLLNLNGGHMLTGIVSNGDGCARPGKPGHYTRVSRYSADMAAAVRELGGTPFNGDSVQPTTKPTNTPTTKPTNEPTATPTQPVGSNSYSQTVNKAIANYGSVSSEINVKGAARTNVSIRINMTHKCLQHLRIDIITPDGKTNTVKKATNATGSQCQSWTGDKTDTYKMQSNTDGRWQIRVSDDFGGESGRFNSWGLNFS